MSDKSFPYEVVVDWSDEDYAYVARVPALPGVAAHGDTEEEAAAQARVAAQAVLELRGRSLTRNELAHILRRLSTDLYLKSQDISDRDASAAVHDVSGIVSDVAENLDLVLEKCWYCAGRGWLKPCRICEEER